MTTVVAYVGIGSNLGEPKAQVMSAISVLERLPGTRLTGKSSLYRSRPWGLENQPDFINAAVRLETCLSARYLLDELLDIERKAGRVRDGLRWGPRVIDLDLLVYGDNRLNEDGLQVPHPRMAERAFVLLPLLELDAELSLSGMGRIIDRLEFVDCSSCLRILESDC